MFARFYANPVTTARLEINENRLKINVFVRFVRTSSYHCEALHFPHVAVAPSDPAAVTKAPPAASSSSAAQAPLAAATAAATDAAAAAAEAKAPSQAPKQPPLKKKLAGAT